MDAAAGAPVAEAGGWSLAARVGFRFAFSYLVLYALPFPLGGFLPEPGWLDALVELYVKLETTVTPWVAAHVLHLTSKVIYQPTGSGDTLGNYVWALCLAAAAAVATLVWSLLDRRRVDYQRLHPWLRLYVRYWLGFILLSYGMAKVIQNQFPPPTADRLQEPLGQFSPMGLLWAFMGYSTPYNFFAGAMEALGGVLVFFRRTTTLGALVTMAVIGNVVLLNFCYDVPVKLFSLHLLAAAIFLASADARRLANVLVLNRPAAPVRFAPYWKWRWARIGEVVLKVAIIGYVLYANTSENLVRYRDTYPVGADVPPLTGSFTVEELVRAGVTVPADAAHADRWTVLNVRGAHAISVRKVDGPKAVFDARYAPGNRLTLKAFGTDSPAGILTWSRPDPQHVVLQGTLDKQPVVMRLRAIPQQSFPLMSRGFHWVQELPFNR